MARLLPLTHSPQQAEGYCLPACVQMVLAYLGIAQSQEVLGRTMDIRLPLGVRRSNIKNLASPQIEVTYESGNLDNLQHLLDQDMPVIVFVDAGELPQWHQHDFTQRLVIPHAVVVAGFDETTIYVMDPALESSPVATPIGDFLLAWDEMDNYYAVLMR